MRKIRFGIAGTGRMAARMAAALASSPDAAPAAVASSSRGRADAFAAPRGLVVFDGAGAMAASPDIDAVYVANRNGLHVETALAALAAGKATLCEKPLATSQADAARLIAAAAQAGVLLVEGLWPLHLPALLRFAAAARDGALGRAVHLYADFGHLAPRDVFPALYARDAGVLRDRMVYLVALSVRVFGPALAVAAEIRRDETGVDVSAALRLEHEGGAGALLAASFLAEMGNSASLACERGVLKLDAPLLGSEGLTAIRRAPPSAAPASPGVKALLAERARSAPIARRARRLFGETREHLSYGADPYHAEIAHFAALLRAGKTESPVVTHALSRETSRILDSARNQKAGA